MQKPPTALLVAVALFLVAIVVAQLASASGANAMGIGLLLAGCLVPILIFLVLGLLGLAAKGPHPPPDDPQSDLGQGSRVAHCPNCESRIPASSLECPHCTAIFSDDGWQPRLKK